MLFSKSTFTALAMAAPVVFAQTYTDCNPTEKTCPNDTGLDATTFYTDFTKGSSANASWSLATGTTLTYGSKGAEFVIAKEGQAPTISSDFYFFFGKVEVVMQAATGTGIVSSIVLESDDLDEIDWEFLGGDTTQVETNYFGKGNTTTYNRAIYYPVSNPQSTTHTYTVDWTPASLTFAIDGSVVRTLNYADAVDGANYPQTPMRVKLGNWAGGASGEPAGTVEWAGGATDFADAPFTMYVESVSVTNYNPGSAYKWTDKTGSYQSIKVIKADGSSASAGSATTVASTSANTVAPTRFLSLKDVQQTAAAVASTNSGSDSLTSAVGDASGKSSASSAKATAAVVTTKASNGTVYTSTESASTMKTTSHASSASKGNSTATSSSSLTQQTTNAGASNSEATAFVALMSIVVAFWAL